MFTPQCATFVETFARVIAHPRLQRYFFIEGGALAVEKTLKTAMDWKVRKNLAAGRGERGTEIIHFKHAFHGRSGYIDEPDEHRPEEGRILRQVPRRASAPR